jgi:pantoate kinase
MSREFAETLGLASGKCRAAIDALEAAGFDASVALFGETVFSLVPSEISHKARDALEGFDGTLLVCEIDRSGARVL